MSKADSDNSTATLYVPEPVDSLYRRTDISPEDFFQALGRARRAVRDEIERLVEWLDSTSDCDEDCAVDDACCDGDPDLEPSLGSVDCLSNQINAWQTLPVTADIDCEEDCGDEGSDCADDREGDELEDGGEAVHEDDEPSLGWTDDEAAHGRSYAGSTGLNFDLELAAVRNMMRE